MSKQTRKWLLWASVGIAVGLATGVAIGWWLWPAKYTNTAPSVLRQDYYDDYLMMTAVAYEVEGNLEQAQVRLLSLAPTKPPAAPVIELAERLVETGGESEKITRLARLAQALGTTTRVLAPYLEGPP
jgi:hypothetical protein